MGNKLSSLVLGCLVILAAAPELARCQDIVISEFMASNRSTITDEDGERSDWLELFNAGASAVNLGGWYLSDDPLDLTKWRLPAVTIGADQFLLVFASGEDRAIAGSQLHTSFKLASEGGYLALVQPNGTTKAWEYVDYPPQIDDFSYGLAQGASSAMLLQSGATAKAFIPTDNQLGFTWTARAFNDSAWDPGSTGIGYDRNPEYVPYINLDVGTEMDNVRASAYIRVPFTLGAGVAYTSLRLRMQYDDGFVAYLNGTEVARRNAPAAVAWDSGATGNHDDAAAVIFEDIDLPGAASLLVTGTNVLAIQGLNNGAGSSDFLIVPELAAFESGNLDRTSRQYFHLPTPGSGNLPGYPGIAEKPLFSRSGGVFTSAFSLTLSSTAPQGVVRYTIDRTVPTESSPAYSGPIAINAGTMVIARVFQPGLAPSPIVSETYLGLAADVQTFNSDLPIILIDDFGGGSITGDPYKLAYMAIFDTGGARSSLENAPDLGTRIGIKTRGSSTGGQAKANYAVETWDEKNNDTDVAPLGMPAESDWVLHAPYNFDLAMMRNPFIYELSNEIGVYAVRTRFVEVYVNTGGGSLSKADYAGVYVFMEKIKRGSDRVNVERLSASYSTEPLITGGYMAKIDRIDPGDSGFGAGGQGLGFVYPKEEIATSTQRSWIQNYIDTFVNVLNGANFRNPTTGYVAYIDPDLWVDHHILNVLANNVDALRLSTYMYKGRNDRLIMGPIWDFDRSIDSTDGRDDNPRAWKGTGDATDFFGYPWWGRLFQDPDFWQKWRDHWTVLRKGPLSVANMNGVIDSMANEIREAQVRNYQKWTGLLGGRTWQGDVNIMKTWLKARAEWIDSQFVAPPTLSSAGRPITPGFSLTMTAAAGTIYYTLDGSDPRAPGGQVAPGALTYSGAITLDANARVFARATTSTSAWSGPADETFVVETPRLVVSELMYHPVDPEVGSPHDADDFEFVELVNAWTKSIVLAGARLSGGIRFTFPDDDTVPLAPGERVVIVKNLEAFSLRYPGGSIRVAGEYRENLSNNGEHLVLEGPLHEPILSFDYSDSWYPGTDGLSGSLFIVDDSAPYASWSSFASWGESNVTDGTPGEDEVSGPPAGYQVPGDSNQDGVLDVSDAISLLLRLFGGGAASLPCGDGIEEGGNVLLLSSNGDANVNITDVVYVLSYLFKNGPGPVRGATCQRITGCPSICR